MKTRAIFPAIAVFVFCLPAAGEWRIDQSRYLDFLRTTGYPPGGTEQGPCEYATQADCQNAIRAFASQMGDSHYASLAVCVECGGSGGVSGTTYSGTPEQRIVQGILGAVLDSVFSPDPEKARQAEIARQQAIERQRAEEMRKQAARLAANKAWQDLQDVEKEKRTFDNAKKVEAGKNLLDKIGTGDGGELKFSTIDSEPYLGDAVDLRHLKGKPGVVKLLVSKEEQERIARMEQFEYDNMPDIYAQNINGSIEQRCEGQNKTCSDLCGALESNVRRSAPSKNFSELQPGDVILLENKGIISTLDNFGSEKNGQESVIGHTVIFLKEVNGVKYFLEDQPPIFDSGPGLLDQKRGGPRIISEAEFMEKYGDRKAEMARLVGQPLNQKEGDRLFHAAVKMAQENRQEKAKNRFGSPWLGTKYGVWGKDDMVCSEADWALINAAIKNTRGAIPETGESKKVKADIKWSPANYLNEQYFLVSPLTYSE